MLITGQPQRAGDPLTWKLPSGLLPPESWVKITQIRTLAVERLSGRIAQLDEADLEILVDGLKRFVV